MTRLLCAWLGRWWLSEDNLTPGSATDGGTHGTVFCPRCGARQYDWRDSV